MPKSEKQDNFYKLYFGDKESYRSNSCYDADGCPNLNKGIGMCDKTEWIGTPKPYEARGKMAPISDIGHDAKIHEKVHPNLSKYMKAHKYIKNISPGHIGGGKPILINRENETLGYYPDTFQKSIGGRPVYSTHNNSNMIPNIMTKHHSRKFNCSQPKWDKLCM